MIGFLDGKVGFEAFADALSAAGYPATTITTLYGDDGIQLLERLKEHSFFFGDSEDSIIQLSMRQLEQGHYAVAIEVTDHQQAGRLKRGQEHILTSLWDCGLPRTKQVAPGGRVFHALHRGVGRRKVFATDRDYLAFEETVEETLRLLVVSRPLVE